MATGLVSDFKIYEEQFFSGLAEKAADSAAIFNERSNGAIILETKDLVGNYTQASFFPVISNLITRQDLTSVAAATSLKATQDEFVGVKVNQKIGPIDNTLNALRRTIAKMTPEAYSMYLGSQIGDAIIQRMVTVGIKALVAAITGNAGCLYDVSTTETLNSMNLISGRALFGDRSEEIVCWIMHSKPWNDLLKNQVAEGLDTISGMALGKGIAATMGRPQVVTDNASLINSAKYYNLGLVPGALRITESEGQNIVKEWVTGLEQLVYRVQGELAFNIEVKGFKYDIANGGSNPADATIATTTNWDQVATSDKDTAGVCVYTL